MADIPWLDYTGQTTDELLACRHSHRIDSIVCAFELGIQRKSKAQGVDALTPEEHLVLALMALDREVNNGGYSQFFVNQSRQFVPIVVDSLERVGCTALAGITRRAIAALQLGDPGRDKTLHACDQEFYRIEGIAENLFGFIDTHQDRIQLVKASLPPPRKPPKPSNATAVYIQLLISKDPADASLEHTRQRARELALLDSIPATDTELEGAAALYAFDRAIHAADLDACEQLAPHAFALMAESTMHCVAHRKWVEQLLAVSRNEQADAATLLYLQYLDGCDPSTLTTQNTILFWASLLQKHRAALRESVAYYLAHFPEDNLDRPLPRQRFQPLDRGGKQ
ncbi:MAG: DUF4375 domain-containing protein [Bryobacteraceae bacterium]|jgi:hypothetical protein